MPNDRNSASRTRQEDADLLDRRSMLERSVGVALAATVFGTFAATPSSAQQGATRIRRVVTGHNAQGKSCVISDEMVSENNIWTTSAADPVGALRPGERAALLPTTRPAIDPPPGGTRITFASFQPSKDPKPSLQNRQGFHRTATIDYIFLLSGEVVLLLDVEEVTLKAGDIVIQRNTEHAWRNDGQTPARAFIALARV